MIELAVLVLAIGGFLVLLDRKDKRHAEQVQTLCQRLQAPEQAVLEHAAQERVEGPLYLNEHDEDLKHLELILGDE